MTQELELVTRNGTELPALIGDPEQQIEDATRAAKALKKVVDQAKLSRRIGQSDHLQFEAWQTVGHFYGITAMIESTRRDEDGTWHARAVTLRHGETIGAAESSCSPAEPTWKDKPAFQVESMAQTRAMGKALRSVLAFVVVLAGYNPTPAEEMPKDATPTWKPSPMGDAPNCQDCNAVMVWKFGKGAKGKWQGWFCSKQKKGENGHGPVFVAIVDTLPERDIDADRDEAEARFDGD